MQAGTRERSYLYSAQRVPGLGNRVLNGSGCNLELAASGIYELQSSGQGPGRVSTTARVSCAKVQLGVSCLWNELQSSGQRPDERSYLYSAQRVLDRGQAGATWS